MPVRMLENRILIDPQHNSEINPDGVVYLGRPSTTFCQGDGHEEQVCMGRVVAKGPGKAHRKTGRRHAPDVEIGEYVAFSDSCHRPMKDGDDDFVVIREDDIIGKSKEPIEHFEVFY